MVRNVNKSQGIALVEIIVTMVILSIGALAFVAITITNNKMSHKTNTNDVAHAIAKDRLAVLQNGDMPLRWINTSTITKDGTKYTVTDTVTNDTVTKTRIAKVSVKWTGSTPQNVSLSGYVTRDMCPDKIYNAPTAINFTTTQIPRLTPAGYTLGKAVIVDADSGDQHQLVLDTNLADNRMFRLVNKTVQTAVTFSNSGTYILKLQAIDCAGMTFTKEYPLVVPAPAPAPVITKTATLTVNENRPSGTVIGTIHCTPDTGISYRISQQSNNVAATINSKTGAVIISDDSLYNYEKHTSFSITVVASNISGADTATFLIGVNDINEAPSALYLSGVLAIKSNGPNRFIGEFSTVDPDVYEHSFSYTMFDQNNKFTLVQDTLKTNNSTNPTPGFYDITVTTSDQAGLTLSKGFTIEIRDTVTPCGTALAWDATKSYISTSPDVRYASYKYKPLSSSINKQPVLATGGSWQYWIFNGACSDTAVCADFPTYTSANNYVLNEMVSYNKVIYKSKGTTNKVPTTATKWTSVCACK